MISNYANFDSNDLKIIYGDNKLHNFPSDFSCKGVSTDTRTIEQGNIFIALKGEKFDAHNNLSEAFDKGAAACIISNEDFAKDIGGKPYIIVKDTQEALGKIAQYHRNRFDYPVIAVAGSNGKTTTKDMIAAVLAKKFKIIKTEGNYNNLVGTPLTLLRLSNEIEAAVIEIGTNMPGEIYKLCEILNPTHGIITNIGKEHLEGFIDLDGVEMEETMLFGYLMKRRNFAFVNIDDIRLAKYADLLDKRVTFGQSPAEVQGKIEFDEEIRPVITLIFDEKETNIRMRTIGMGTALNAIAASVVGLFFGLELDEVKKALEEFEIPAGKGYGRMVIEKIGSYIVINDCYNANPPSMEIAIDALLRYPKDMPKVAILGDMRELGDDSIVEHEEVLHKALEADAALLYGDDFTAALAKMSAENAKAFQNKEELAAYFEENYKEAVALVKGSRGLAMETIISKLKDNL